MLSGVRVKMTKILEKPEKVDQEESGIFSQEIEYPETVFVRDIENRVFQNIVLQCLAKIKGICLLDRKFIDNILGREGLEGIKGIHAEQDSKSNAVNVRVEVKIYYGISIPEKAEEIQTKITEEIVKLTGLHVASVHVVFKNVILSENDKNLLSQRADRETPLLKDNLSADLRDEL